MHIWGSSVTTLMLTISLWSWISKKPQSQLSEWFVVWTLNLFPYLAFQICILIFIYLQTITVGYCYLFLHFLKVWPLSHTVLSTSVCIKLCSLPCSVYCSVIHQSHSSFLSIPGLCCHSLGVVLSSQDQCAWVFIFCSVYYNIHLLTTFASLTTMHLTKGKVY